MCSRCQRTLPWNDGRSSSVDFCEISISPLKYQDGVRNAVHRYKFNAGSMHSRLFGTLMAQALHDNWSEPLDAVLWVPLSKRHRRKRGYDQAELLAHRVAQATGLPLVDGLEKTRNTATQSQLEKPSERRANVLGAYQVRKGSDLTGKRVVLVDDVVTSGATLAECASCLRMAGVESVVALTCAQAKK